MTKLHFSRPILVSLLLLLLTACGASTHRLPTPSFTPIPPPTQPIPASATPLPIPSHTPTVTSTNPPTSTSSRTSTPKLPATATGTVTPIFTAIIPPEARLKFQCLKVEPTLPSEVVSSGIVVLESRVTINGRYSSDTFLLNMVTRKTTQIALTNENQVDHFMSPDRKLLAYKNVILRDQDKIIREELVIATADGQQQKTIPWEEKWLTILDWLDNQRLIISYDDPTLKSNGKQTTPFAYLVLNPFSGERQVISPDYPGFLDVSSTVFPYWGGWDGVIFDPTLTRAVYPRYIGVDNIQYTYALWDVSKHELVASLEKIFTPMVGFMNPMPRWLPDGSQFMFTGTTDTPSGPISELFRVNRDGQAEQLTHLGGYAEIVDSSYSWSPDEQHIALFLNNGEPGNEKAQVAVLNMITMEVTNYCISVTFGGEGYGDPELPGPPLWSPDSTEFLMIDWYEKDHQSVILVDIAQGFATKITEDMEPEAGW